MRKLRAADPTFTVVGRLLLHSGDRAAEISRFPDRADSLICGQGRRRNTLMPCSRISACSD
jgi:hypothetical protein